MNKNKAFDASIPVLTEVFQEQSFDEEAPVVVEEAVPAPNDVELVEELAADSSREPLWADMERRLSARILVQLQDGVDFVTEERVRQSLEAALQSAIAGLTAEIRSSLQQTIEKVVAEAVATELAHLRTLEK